MLTGTTQENSKLQSTCVASLAEPYEVARKRELVVEIARLDNAMTALESRLRKFRESNFISLDGCAIWRESVGLPARSDAQRELQALQAERNTLLTTWNATLAEYASL